jgi:hypothetical protein
MYLQPKPLISSRQPVHQIGREHLNDADKKNWASATAEFNINSMFSVYTLICTTTEMMTRTYAITTTMWVAHSVKFNPYCGKLR